MNEAKINDLNNPFSQGYHNSALKGFIALNEGCGLSVFFTSCSIEAFPEKTVKAATKC